MRGITFNTRGFTILPVPRTLTEEFSTIDCEKQFLLFENKRKHAQDKCVVVVAVVVAIRDVAADVTLLLITLCTVGVLCAFTAVIYYFLRQVWGGDSTRRC
jgi:hypothetical protein